MTERKRQNDPIGYARVGTYGQTLDVQLEQKASRCARIYRERATGAKAGRREPQRLLKGQTTGDVVAWPTSSVT